MKNAFNTLIFALFSLLSSGAYAQQPINCDQNYDVYLPPPVLDTLVVTGFGPNPIPPPVFTNSLDRAVFWIHGLGGNEGSWEQAAWTTEYQVPGTGIPGYVARKVDSYRPDYGKFSSASIQSAAQTTYDIIEDGLQASASQIDPTKSMIIAHSQGGIVSRTLDLLYDDPNSYPPLTHGIVTFGTPHLGAKIITNKDQIFKLLGDGCYDLSAGPLEELIDFPGPFKLPAFLDDFINEEKYIHKLDTLLCGNILPLAVTNVAGSFLSGTLNDFCDTCPFVNILTNHSNYHSTHRVAFWGEEDSPEFLRLLHFQVGKGVNEYAPFEADYDSSLINMFDTMYMNYQLRVATYQNTYNYYTGQPSWPFTLVYFAGAVPGIWSSVFANSRNMKKAREAQKKRDAFQRGVTWMATSNEKWLSIIGGYEYVTTGEVGCKCEYKVTTGEEGVSFVPAATATACLHYTPPNQGAYNYFRCEWIDEEDTVKTKVPTDGVVTAPSAKAFPGAGQNKKSMPHSNHFQMRNDSRAKDRLNELWGGTYGPFFITNPR
jgi:pimeloyl-ACP methyl ester carboxylesterase